MEKDKDDKKKTSVAMKTIAARQTALQTVLAELESEIYERENKYLEESMEFGNYAKGWDGLLSLKPPKTNGGVKNKVSIKKTDRLLARSSVSGTNAGVRPPSHMVEEDHGAKFGKKKNKKKNKKARTVDDFDFTPDLGTDWL